MRAITNALPLPPPTGGEFLLLPIYRGNATLTPVCKLPPFQGLRALRVLDFDLPYFLRSASEGAYFPTLLLAERRETSAYAFPLTRSEKHAHQKFVIHHSSLHYSPKGAADKPQYLNYVVRSHTLDLTIKKKRDIVGCRAIF